MNVAEYVPVWAIRVILPQLRASWSMTFVRKYADY